MSRFSRGKTNQAGAHSSQPSVASASIRVLSPTFISNEDPTKTITLRSQYITDVNNRFNALKTVIRQSVVDNDCFGLVDKPQSIEEIMALGYKEELAKLNAIPKEGFRFLRNDQKVEEFMKWLTEQQEKGVLEIVQRPGRIQKGISSWQNTYIQSAYQKGLSRARSDLIKSGVDIPSWAEIPGGVSGAFYQAMHADAVGLIFTRAYNELKGVTAAMDQQISRVLASGLVEGIGPYEMARRINDRVDKIGINRARTIARTETIQTFNTAVINEFATATNVLGEKVFCQWWTARDDRVRLHHANRHGRVFSQERARELIGEPNCRCTLVPYIKSIHQKGGILRPGKGGTIPPKGSTPIITPPKPKGKPKEPAVTPADIRNALLAQLAKQPKSFDYAVRAKTSELYNKIARTYADEGDAVAIRKMKEEVMADITRVDSGVNMTAAMKKKVMKSVEWMPYDILEQLRLDGYILHIRNKVKYGYYSRKEGKVPGFRAYFRSQTRSAVVAKDDTYDVLAHELAHAVDDMWSGNYSTGGVWHYGSGKFATKADAENFRSWFVKKIDEAGYTQGKYSNGDGFFWRDNWLNDYEGRIYDAPGMKHGVEWWAMNVQRYAKYRFQITYFDEYVKKKKKDLADLLERRKQTVGIGETPPAWMERKIKSLKKLTKESAEDYAARTSDWAKARKRYPELTQFIEDKFGGFLAA